MKFSVEKESFSRLLEILAQAASGRGRKFAPLHLEASWERLRVFQAGLAAEIEAMIWQEGRCAVSGLRLKQALDAQPQAIVLVQLEGNRLRLGAHSVSCTNSSNPGPELPSRIFFASKVGVIPSHSLASLSEVA